MSGRVATGAARGHEEHPAQASCRSLGTYQRLIVLTPMTIVPLPPESELHQYRERVVSRPINSLAVAEPKRKTLLMAGREMPVAQRLETVGRQAS
jgi:hypothetical protein